MKRTIRLFAFLALIFVLSSCIKIPIDDSESLKLSKDGITVSDSEVKESTLKVDKDGEVISVSNKDGEEWEATYGEDVALSEDFPNVQVTLIYGIEYE